MILLRRAHVLWKQNSVQARRYSGQRVTKKAELTLSYRLHKIQLTFHYPETPKPKDPLIIHLDPGLPVPIDRSQILSQIVIAANATLVNINPIGFRQYHHPLALHSTLFAKDWLLHNDFSSNEKVAPYLPHQNQLTPIGICGELIGGSLAAALALTECRRGHQPIRAAALGNPIADWTALPYGLREPQGTLDGLVSHSQHEGPAELNAKGLSQSEGAVTIHDLLDLRKKLFTKPEGYFDPFASPLLFFRTPSSELPTQDPAQTHSSGDPDAEEHQTPVRHRSHRKHPPHGSDLVLPNMRVNVGTENALSNQGIDLVNLARRSYTRMADGNTSPDSEETRFDLVKRDGLGLWDENESKELGEWFGKVLRKD